jgi:hypothetical protein
MFDNGDDNDQVNWLLYIATAVSLLLRRRRHQHEVHFSSGDH